MSLNITLDVNGKVIGEATISRCHEYRPHQRQQKYSFAVTQYQTTPTYGQPVPAKVHTGNVWHEYKQGAWKLVQKVLERVPFEVQLKEEPGDSSTESPPGEGATNHRVAA